jgi:hypothetical protein
MASNYKSFCAAVIAYQQTDMSKDLTKAMELRNELIRSGEFTADFLDGLTAGLTGNFSLVNLYPRLLPNSK